VPPARSAQAGHQIVPLSFLQIYQSADSILNALLEQDSVTQRWFGGSPLLRSVVSHSGMPLYYHWATSGYGVLNGDELLGWMFLRGWEQVLYVETLAVRPQARRRGVATALLDFATQIAQELHREWLGLTVTVTNENAVRLYEGQKFQPGHWRILKHENLADIPWGETPNVELRRLLGPGAERAFKHFSKVDLEASDPDTVSAHVRFLPRELYRRVWGRHWGVRINGRMVAYLHHHRYDKRQIVYLASEPQWWGSPMLLQTLLKTLAGQSAQCDSIEVRLASRAHHEAACAVLVNAGFSDEPALTMKMIRNLRKDGPLT
jgi:GNAT superfamily N-acetyltransferase